MRFETSPRSWILPQGQRGEGGKEWIGRRLVTGLMRVPDPPAGLS